MNTRVIKIDPLNIDYSLMKRAAEFIKKGGLVAFPTETVYGLGAKGTDEKAVAKIFEAKARPLEDPLIVHIKDKNDLYKIAKDVPRLAEKLIEKFWPGPLTIILKKNKNIPDIVTAGLDTVAVRMPSNPIARVLIELSDVSIPAPSANLFGRPSPTSAEHVLNDLDSRIDMVIDGGICDIGLESTVIEFRGNEAAILRPGGITLERLCEIEKNIIPYDEKNVIKNSPGKYPCHYSPKAKVVIAENNAEQIENVLSLSAFYKKSGYKTGIMCKKEHAGFLKSFDYKELGPSGDFCVCAGRLFSILREFDDEKFDVIIAEGIEEKELGIAIMNRLRKAVGTV
ncbi:tRNA threonylcarbamoyladenosine biosynthesis protein [Candidatus Omnitrophus magneticus]|uniref:Threonylcarbamoyl-AMP synthase n=1 Tax=Candidatus Omnitrophus magneticus TaxID=1609969 RepID=A0A0F0CVE7_9BACT|nr:tRNA threonylcarbamoyladenosine biosynthesis protein [Candidatus Omnitrophus magneticus]